MVICLLCCEFNFVFTYIISIGNQLFNIIILHLRLTHIMFLNIFKPTHQLKQQNIFDKPSWHHANIIYLLSHVPIL